MNWKPGDRAICLCKKGKDAAKLSGKMVILVSRYPDGVQNSTGEIKGPTWDVGGYFVAEKCLRPIDEDGMRKTTWDKCVWRPGVTIEN